MDPSITALVMGIFTVMGGSTVWTEDDLVDTGVTAKPPRLLMLLDFEIK